MSYICLKQAKFASGVYTLIPVREQDMEQIRLWRNEQIAILRQKAPLSKEEQEIYFKQQVKPGFALQQPPNILFSFLREDILVGYGGLVHLDWKARTGEISFLLGTPHAQELSILIQLLLQAAFEDLSLQTLFAEVYDWGTERKEALEQAGFSAYKIEENRKIHQDRILGATFYRKHNPDPLNDI